MAGEGGGGGGVFVPTGGGGGGSNIFSVLGNLFGGGGGGSNSERRDRQAAADLSGGIGTASEFSLKRAALNPAFGHLHQLAIDELAFRAGTADRPFIEPRSEVPTRAPIGDAFVQRTPGGFLDRVDAETRRVLDGGAQPRADQRLRAWLDFLSRIFDAFGFGHRNTSLSGGAGARGPFGLPVSQLPRTPTRPAPGAATPGGEGGSVSNVPVTMAGDPGHLGNAPGFDIGDIFGPNSFLANLAQAGSVATNPLGALALNQDVFRPSDFPVVVNPRPTNGVAGNGGGGCPVSPFRGGGRTTATAVPFVAVNPVSGRPVWFGPLGKPVLWTGDLRACKRVARVASRAARSRPRRRARRGGR